MLERSNVTRGFLGLVLCAIVVTMYLVPASAVEPRYVGVVSLTSDLSITSNGRATCKGGLETDLGYTSDVTMELQQQSGNTWTTIHTWTAEGAVISFEKSIYVVSGHNYRVKVSADVYNSNSIIVESPVAYSQKISY